MTTDHDAVAKLIYSYAELIDAGRFEDVAELFAHATVRSDRRPEIRRGREEVLRLYRDAVILYGGKPCTKHVTTNLVVEMESDTMASARSYYSVLQARPELALQVIIAGRYHDQFERLGGAWRFTDRLIFVDLVGDLSFHLKRNNVSG